MYITRLVGVTGLRVEYFVFILPFALVILEVLFDLFDLTADIVVGDILVIVDVLAGSPEPYKEHA